jgi:hypothetical protein
LGLIYGLFPTSKQPTDPMIPIRTEGGWKLGAKLGWIGLELRACLRIGVSGNPSLGGQKILFLAPFFSKNVNLSAFLIRFSAGEPQLEPPA